LHWKIKGEIEIAAICSLLSQRYRNIAAETGAAAFATRHLCGVWQGRLSMLDLYACGAFDTLQEGFKSGYV